MKLTALRLYNVKRFAGRGVALEGIGDGVNVLCAVNEFGKSTCFEALHALFFQPHGGTPGAVQMLRPYSGGNPLIEADIATGEGRFRVTKQFYGGRRASVTDLATGRLVAQADEAEAFIGRLVHGGSGGPAGLLWVRQGATGIERRSKSDEEGERQVRESLLSSVQGEVEALTGGRRMKEVMERCEADLARLVTPTLRAKAGSRYAAALEERARLVAEEQRLEGEVRSLRAALDARRQARARLAEIEEPGALAARQAAVTAAEAAFASARAHGAALQAAEAEAGLARERYAAARQALELLQAALARHAQLVPMRAAAEQRRAEAIERQMAARAAAEVAQGAADAAEIEAGKARALLDRLEKALRAREAAERLAEARRMLEGAEAARQEVEALEAALGVLEIPAEGVARLEALELEIAGLRAVQAAPSLRIDYLPGVAGAVRIDGVPLADGEARHFSGSLALSIAGVGALTLTADRGAQGDATLGAAEEKRKALLAKLGVASLGEARQRQAAGQAKAAELGLARQRLAHLAPKGLGRLREAIARLEAESAGELELKGDPEQARVALIVAEQHMAGRRNAARETRPALQQADEAVLAAERELMTVGAELDGLEARLVPAEDREAALARLTDSLARLGVALAEVSARTEQLQLAATDLAGAEAGLARAKSVLAAADTERARLREGLADLNGQIRTRAEDAVEEAWRETSEAKAAVEAEIARIEAEVAALVRLRDALNAARTGARDQYLSPVMAELRPLLGLLFDDVAVEFDQDTLLPQRVRRNGQEEDVERLSGGMREQLSVLTRLAFARLLARDGRAAPVILDDALVYSDDDRIVRMFDALHRQARDQQIIVFSCRQRAFAELGGNVLQMQDWQPAQ